jgi:hypothetical protein
MDKGTEFIRGQKRRGEKDEKEGEEILGERR